VKIDSLKCDTCNFEYRIGPMSVGTLPTGWYALTKGNGGLVIHDKHFCSIECLIKWTSLQTVDSRKFDLGGIEVKVNESMLRRESE